MKNNRWIGFFGLAALAASVGAQSGVNMTPLAKEPPKAMLGARSTGAKPGSDILHLAVSLQLRDQSGLKNFIDTVSDPKSPNYRHFIQPEEVGQRFGLSQSEVAKVASYLASQGMTIRKVAKNRLSILVDASVAQAQAAFSTSIETFITTPSKQNDNGTRFSFTTPPELPVSIVADVVDIAGLESFTRPKFRNLTPSNLQGLYATAPFYKNGKQGQGRTIAISNWDGFRVSGEVLACKNFSLPVPAAGAGSNITIEAIDGGDGGNGFQYGEGDLDIQATIGMAPLCNLIVYDNYLDSGNSNYIDVLTQEADDNTADVITESYGWSLDGPTGLAASNIHASMAAEGITYLAASGDSGTDFGGYNYPVIDPNVLTVGGTSAIVNAANQRVSEVGWNSDGGAGGGGWVATTDPFNIRPPYQSGAAFLAGAGVPSLTDVPYRLIPDIALNADPNTGYYVWFSTGSQIIGGTSGASPTCAGGLGVAEEQLIADGYLPADGNGHSRFGRIADLLYSYNGDGAVFYDIVSGTNGELPNGQNSQAGIGWDFDSGWGAIVFSGLIARIENIPQVDSLKLSASIINGGAPVTATINLTVPAAGDGVTVNLISSDPNAQVPATVVVPAGSQTATFPVTTNGVSVEKSLYIEATNAYGAQSANLLLFPATYSALTVSPNAIAGGNTATGTISLQGAAPAGGYIIYLSSSSSIATVPATVTVPANATSTTFPIATSILASSSSVTITGIAGNSKTLTATLSIQTTAVQTIDLSSSSVVGGSATPVVCTIILDGPAKTGGATVTLSSSNPKLATVPSSVKVAAGKTTITFTVTHLVSASGGTVTITAKLNGSSTTASLTVTPFEIVSFSVSPSSVTGGATSTGIVTLNAAPGSKSGPISVKLSGSPFSGQIPGTVSVAIGKTTAQFAIKTKAVAGLTYETFTGTLPSGSESATLTVNPPVLTAVSLTPSTVTGSSGTRVVGTVTFSGPLPAGGFVVQLSSSNSSVAGVPASVTVPAGKTSVTFTVTHTAVIAQTQVTITATSADATQTASLTVNPN